MNATWGWPTSQRDFGPWTQSVELISTELEHELLEAPAAPQAPSTRITTQLHVHLSEIRNRK